MKFEDDLEAKLGRRGMQDNGAIKLGPKDVVILLDDVFDTLIQLLI